MLRIENLSVSKGGKRILENINMEIGSGEVHALFGPNGCGKTTLLMSIMGMPGNRITSGSIYFKGKDITSLTINERAKLGLGMAFQRPPGIKGVKLGDLVNISSGNSMDINKLVKEVKIPKELLDRDVNIDFSGGESKKSEIMQLLAQKPRLVLFDEPDSGVDVESIEVISRAMNKILRGKTGLIVTHLGYILNNVKADKAHVMINGRIACSGNQKKILDTILSKGYGWCEKCVKKKMRTSA